MTPKPARDRAADLREMVRDAKTKRDAAVEAADREFWQRIGEITSTYHGAQTDAAEELDITPRWLAKQIKRHL
jgi:transcriptional regulator with GAF, ATPase, and Fis domain